MLHINFLEYICNIVALLNQKNLMKKLSLKFILLSIFACFFLLTSCEDHDHEHDADNPNTEYRYIRVLVSDENSKTLSLVNPWDGSVTPFEASHAKSSLYATESNRFMAIIHRDNNLTQTFDTGLENHGDHVDVKGTPKFGALTGESLQPTHFKSKRGELLTFNDGDGTLSIGFESDIHNPAAKMTSINAGLLKHHGAMATFSNGTYAITEKDNSIAGTLPERVKVINQSGATLHESKIATQGIHGNATDGTYAVFGSASGILVVESNGNQKLIAHPSDFGTAWFGTILETAKAGKFIGYTAAKGAYLIDVTVGTVTPVIQNTDIMQCKVSYDGTHLGVLLHSGSLRIIDLDNLNTEQDATVIVATDKSSTQKPQLELTSKFAYITSPTTGELLQISLNSPTNIKKLKVSSTPYRLVIAGYESNASH